MIFKLLYLYFVGVVDVVVEGFFIERFINICKSENIILWNSKIEKGTILYARIAKQDFEEVHNIASKTSCIVNIKSEKGMPFTIKKYKKRKAFAVAIFVIAFFCFIITRFIWNIDIYGNDQISREEILSDLANYGIAVGKLKYNLNLDEIKNEIRLNRNDLACIGIDIKGTNVLVKVVESRAEPRIIDENTSNNIFADKSGVVSKMIIRSGTARVNVRRYSFRRRFAG